MKVCAIGTSNMILRMGFISGLQTTLGEAQFTNLSIGASSSALIPYAYKPDVVADSDFILIDFTVNESGFLEDGSIDEAVIERSFHDFLCRVSSTGCIPIVLVFPAIIAPERRRAARIYCDLAREAGVPYFDMFDWLARIQSLDKLPNAHYFRDASHMNDLCATAAAFCLSDVLPRVRDYVAGKRADTVVSTPELIYISASDMQIGDAQFRDRKSWLLADRFVRLEGGESCVFNDSDYADAEIVAVLGNLGETASTVEICGDDGLTFMRPVPNSFKGTDNALVAAVRPVKALKVGNGLTIRNGAVPAELQSRDAALTSEIAGIVLSKPKENRRQLRFAVPAMDIGDLVTDDVIRRWSITVNRAHAQMKIADAPARTADAPATTADEPAKVADAPAKVADAPTTAADAPAKIADAPAKIAGAMTKMADAMTKMADALTKMADAPAKTAGAPIKKTRVPRGSVPDRPGSAKKPKAPR